MHSQITWTPPLPNRDLGFKILVVRFSQSEFGKCFTFIYPSIRKEISLSEAPVFNFILNSNISHRIFIHDPQYFMLMVNPSTFPRIERSIARPEINHMSLMQFITVTKHIKKKRSNHLCNDDSDYDFLVCVKQHIADTIGCKPEWENISKDVPNCTTLDQLNEHDATYINLSIINTREVFEKTKCLSPCRFKVCIRSIEPNYPFLMSSMTGIGWPQLCESLQPALPLQVHNHKRHSPGKL